MDPTCNRRHPEFRTLGQEISQLHQISRATEEDCRKGGLCTASSVSLIHPRSAIVACSRAGITRAASTIAIHRAAAPHPVNKHLFPRPSCPHGNHRPRLHPISLEQKYPASALAPLPALWPDNTSGRIQASSPSTLHGNLTGLLQHMDRFAPVT